MTDISHKNITGDQVHEPKGITTAASGTAYIADGVGSGSWQAVGFSTGDIKPTFKTSADAGWVLLDDGTIGNASSSATTRANADCQDLFTLLWNNIADAYCPVSSGRGASAAADWAANKRIAIPKTLGRVLGAAGTGAGFSNRPLGSIGGEETHTLTQGQLPAVSPTFTGSTQTWTINQGGIPSGCNGIVIQGGDSAPSVTYTGIGPVNVTVTPSGTISALGSGQAFTQLQPTVFVNYMIKL